MEKLPQQLRICSIFTVFSTLAALIMFCILYFDKDITNYNAELIINGTALGRQLARTNPNPASLKWELGSMGAIVRNGRSSSAKNSSIADPVGRREANTELSDVSIWSQNVWMTKTNIPISCSLFEGRWMWDAIGYPLYQSDKCPFIDAGFRCQENGRPDGSYMHWRWQPHACNLPRFDAAAVLERLRNKRLVFVGDSIGRNQWESMLCMLAQAVPAHERRHSIYEVNGQPITKHTGFLSFRFRDYNCTVEYYRSPFLVPQARPPPHAPPNVSTVLLVEEMDWSSRDWMSADIITFNTGHWWSYGKIMRAGTYFQVGRHVNTSMDVRSGFCRAMRTWRQWVAKHVDFERTIVFFRTYAPAHFSGGTWRNGGTCHQETEPYKELVAELEDPWTNAYVADEVAHARKYGAKVQLLEITHLSNYRRDGHASIYHVGVDEPRPMRRQDCSHWCLPGLPDTWNELLLALLDAASVPTSRTY